MLSKLALLAAVVGFSSFTVPQQIAQDPCRGATPVEVVHLYYDEYPQGRNQHLLALVSGKSG